MKRISSLGLGLLLILAVLSEVCYAQTKIHNWEELHNIRNNLSGNYILAGDLSAETAGYEDYNSGSGWLPIGIL